MAYSVVQRIVRSNSAGLGSYQQVIFPSSPTNGNMAFAIIANYDGTVLPTGVSDDRGNAWSVVQINGATNYIQSAGPNPVTMACYYCPKITAGGATTTVTANWASGLHRKDMFLLEATGFPSAGAAVDQCIGSIAYSVANKISAGTFATLAQAAEVGGMMFFSNRNPTALDGSWTADQTIDDFLFSRTARIVTASTTGFSASWSIAESSAADHIILAVLFKDAAAGTPTLTSPFASATGLDSASAGFTTSSASGTAYFLRRTGATPAGASTIIASGESQSITSTTVNRAMTAFTSGTAYYVDMCQSGPSNVVSAGPFTPSTMTIAGTALSAQAGTQGTAFSWTGVSPQSLVSGGIGSKTFTATGLTGSGLSPDPTTGILSGTCGTPATYSVTFTCTDSSSAGTTHPQTVTKGATVVISATGGTATSVTVSGPSGGLVNVASTNFTVGANGTISGTVVVTPSDSGGGGVFTPTTVSISAASPSATFTYTPGTTGAKAISVTNGGGLANPSALTYTVTTAGTFTATFGPAYYSTGSGPQTGKAANWTVFLGGEPGALSGVTGIDQSGTSDSSGVWTATNLPSAGAGVVIAKDEDGGVYFKNITAA